MLYPWIKVLHIVAVISWMAGLLYLPRLIVYHCQSEQGSEQSETFKTMERRLLKIIMTPAMVVSWAAGLWLAWQAGWFPHLWFQAKLLLVFVLSGVHMYLASEVRRLAADQISHSPRYWRIVNEIPAILMIAIVVLVVIKPF